MEALKHVHIIPLGDVKAFILEGESTVLVDAGIKPVHQDVINFFMKSGFKLGDEKEMELLRQGSFKFIKDFINKDGFNINKIICTHFHNDHTGCLKQLKEALHVPVAMHPMDIPYVEGKQEQPVSKVLPPELAKHFKSEPCMVEIELEDEQMFTRDIRIIHLEGHTKGHICILFKDKVLLAADSLMGKNRDNPLLGPDEINPPMDKTSMNHADAVKNLKKLLNYDFEIIIPSHGEAIKDNARDKLKRFVEGLA
jgi:glyoxylase-like metal-dependent hydrolase (beta-lactamase superfamily II)